jgi:hypothetical protein
MVQMILFSESRDSTESRQMGGVKTHSLEAFSFSRWLIASMGVRRADRVSPQTTIVASHRPDLFARGCDNSTLLAILARLNADQL